MSVQRARKAQVRDGPSRDRSRRAAGSRRGPERAGPPPVAALPDGARPRRRPTGLRARPARGPARPRGRAPGLPPPLLYGSSIFANFNDFRGDLRWLALNTVGLVLVTMAVVAWVAHALIPGLPWAAAFVLGAIVSPTDPLAAATIMRRLGVPRRLVSAVEGEGLFNDATALVAYRVAVAAVVAGSFSVAQAGLRFVLGAAGGVAIGITVGWIVAELRQHTTDTQISVTMSLLTGYAAFVPADAVGASGVLAAVTAGIYMGIRGPRILPVGARLQGAFV